MLVIQAITKIFGTLVLAGACVLMAQDLAAQSVSENLDASQNDRVSDSGSTIGESVRSASDSAVSAAISASVGSESSAKSVGMPQYIGRSEGQRSLERSVRSAELGSLNKKLSTLGSIKNQSEDALGTGIQESTGLASNLFRLRKGALPQSLQTARNLSRRHRDASDLQSGALNSNGNEETTYVSDFSDSTRGTAPASPPDPGTASPLNWAVGFDPGLPEFGAGDILNPSLHVGGRSNPFGRSNAGGRSTNMRSRRLNSLRVRRNGLSQKQPASLFGSPDQQLEPNILARPPASDPLSIDRQLGLQNDLSSGPLNHQ